nr:CBS domain-containing protein [Streptomyces sp. HNM0575]
MAVPYESVTVGSDALEAARLMAGHRLPALIVLGEGGEPRAILPASQMLKTLVPPYVLEDPALAAVVDEEHADRLAEALEGHRVGDCLPPDAGPPPVADADDTLLEVAALMARVHSPLVAVTATGGGGGTELLGVVTASHLLGALLLSGD